MATDDMTRSGYSREEEYFYKKSQEQIQRKRKALDAQREARQQAEGAGEHWMRCPKCGKPMEEVGLAQIKLDKCTGCQGVYFDHGELETLLESREPQVFLVGLRKLLG